MAITIFDETWSSGLKTSVNDKGQVTATSQRKFNLFTDNANDTDLVAKMDPRLPVEKSRHPIWLLLYCDNVDLQRKSPVWWEATCSYSSAPYRDQGSSPFDQPTEVEVFSVTNEEPIDEDQNGSPLVTPNGEPIMGLTRPITDMGVRLTKNFTSFDPATFYTFSDAVNSDTFLGFPPGVLKVMSINARQQFQDDFPFWNVGVEIHARKPYRTTNAKAWWKRYRLEGFYIREGAFVRRALDDAGEPVVEPVMLNADGTKRTDQTTAIWVERQMFATVAFSSMGF